jgi:hypothetical protein
VCRQPFKLMYSLTEFADTAGLPRLFKKSYFGKIKAWQFP